MNTHRAGLAGNNGEDLNLLFLEGALHDGCPNPRLNCPFGVRLRLDLGAARSAAEQLQPSRANTHSTCVAACFYVEEWYVISATYF